MRTFLYFLALPFLWLAKPFMAWKRWGFRYTWETYVVEVLDDFFFEHHDNGVFGPGYYGWKTFKSGNLALVIASLTALGFILFLVL